MARTLVFRVPLEEPQPTLLELLKRSWPEGTTAQIQTLFDSGRVRVDDRVSKNPDKQPEPEEVCEIDVPAGEQTFGFPEVEELARGEGWIVIEKPRGLPAELNRDDPVNPVLFMADAVGADRETFTPVWTMDATMGGPWLCATDAPTAIELRKQCSSGEIVMTWTAICVAPAVAAGMWTHDDVRIQYATTRMQDGLAELQLTPQFDGKSVDPVPFLLDALEHQGCPIVGARSHGGHLTEGGMRLRLMALVNSDQSMAHSWNPRGDWWPKHPVIEVREVELELPASDEGSWPTLQVSHTTLDVIAQKGHPWVIADKDTGDRRGIKPGRLVQLRTKNGRTGPFAIIEGDGELAARVWGEDEESITDFHEEVLLRLDEAIARRSSLFADLTHSDAIRLVHAENDALPGFYLDRLGPIFRATVAGGASYAFRKYIYDSLADSDPHMTILETVHTEDIRSNKNKLPQARMVRGSASYVHPGKRMVIREHGLKYWIDPWEGIDVGFFHDQRDNRAELLECVQPGEHWLNLFCHTGAFSVALRSVGATVVSNDLSKRYLEWLDDNLDLNGFEDGNENVAEDARAYLDRTDAMFDGIIVDPPTAARSDEGFWSIRKHYEDHLVQCFEHLNPGGRMLVCRNDRKKTKSLKSLVEAAAECAGRKIASTTNAPPSLDFPVSASFPEGTKFEALWVSTKQ